VNIVSLAARNVRRNPLRTILTAVGVGSAIFLFVLVQTANWAWTSGSTYAPKDRIFTRHKVSMILDLPMNYVDKVRTEVPGIAKATWANWFGVDMAALPGHEHDFFAAMAVDDATWFDVWDDFKVDPDQLKAWKEDKQGAIIGAKLASKMGWKVGDTVPLKSAIFPGDWQFHIDGLYTTESKAEDPRQFFMHWSYFDDNKPAAMGKGRIGWITSRTKPGASSVEVSKQIDALFDPLDTQTLSQDEHAFQASFMGMFETILSAMDIVSLVILLFLVVILGNTVMMAARERTAEYGVLRAIGFLPHHLAGLVVGEALALGVLGGGIGLVLGWPFVNFALGRWITENMGNFFPAFEVPTHLALEAFGLAILVALVASAAPAWLTYRLRVVDAIRRVA